MAIQKQNYVLGRGRLYFDDGEHGERYIGNTPEFNLSTSTESLEHFNSDEELLNRDRNIVTQINYSGSFTTDNIAPENLAMLFMGDSTTLTQESLTGETDTFEDGVAYAWYQLGEDDDNPAGKRMVSNISVEVDPDGTAEAAEEGTDYEVDAERGRIQVLEDGLLDGQTFAVTYDVDESSRSAVVSGDKQIIGKLRFVSANPDGAGEQRDFFMPSVTISGNGDFALKAESDWQAIPFSVEITKSETTEAVYADGLPYSPS